MPRATPRSLGLMEETPGSRTGRLASEPLNWLICLASHGSCVRSLRSVLLGVHAIPKTLGSAA
eukprot:6177261-Pleurochrysis_carterae.AAC.1